MMLTPPMALSHDAPPLWLAAKPVAVVAATGPDAVQLLNRLGTQDIRDLRPGATRFGLFVTHQGKLVAQTRIVAAPEGVWLITDALMGRPLVDWLEKYTITEDAEFRVLNESWPALRVVGGAGQSFASSPLAAAAQAVAPFAPVAIDVPRGWGVGVDWLIAETDRAAALAALRAHHLEPVSAQAFERARLTVGEPAVGHDLAPLSQPLEWRLGTDGISWTKGCFVGQEVLGRLDNFNKVARLCMGIRASAGFHALQTPEHRASARIVIHGSAVGKISSVVEMGSDQWVGLGLVKREAACAQPAVLRSGTGEEFPLALEDRPFWAAAAR